MGFGCMGLSGVYGSSHDEEGMQVIRAALEAGVTYFDTADVYGAGHNEELLGRALQGWSGPVVVASKFGLSGTSAGGKPMRVNGSPEYVRQACHDSLRRLGREVIDLYYLHRVDPHTPIEETVQAMAGLVREGKVRYLGLSEAGAVTLRRAQAVHPISALQSEWSLWTRDIEETILSTCRELGLGLVPWSPLGRGFLTGQLKTLEQDDFRRQSPRFQEQNFARNLELLRQFEDLARGLGASPAQLALAWLLAQGEDVVPIPGTRRIARLRENLGALELSLSPQDRAAIEALFPPGAAAGARYPEAQLKMVNL